MAADGIHFLGNPLIIHNNTRPNAAPVPDSAAGQQLDDMQAEQPADQVASPPDTTPVIEQPTEHELLLKDDRQFNLDVLPRSLWSNGPEIDLLVRSGVAKYVEFRCYQHAYMLADNGLQQVG